MALSAFDIVKLINWVGTDFNNAFTLFRRNIVLILSLTSIYTTVCSKIVIIIEGA